MSDEDVKDLELVSIIGFDGTAIQGLNIHPDGVHFVYPLGSKVVIQNWKTKKQSFLSGHTNVVSAVAISPNGKYIASGQINHLGFKADVVLWSFESCKSICKYELHKLRVQSVSFSCDNKYLISLGGRDDNTIIVWDIGKKEALCGATVSRGTLGETTILCCTNLRSLCFVTGGDGTMRIWKIISDKRQAQAMDVKFGLVKRRIICMVIDEWDTFAFCGTTTGDIMKVKLNFDSDLEILDPVVNPVLLGCFGKYIGKKRLAAGEDPGRYSQGVTALQLWPSDMEGRIIVGGGDGTIELVKEHSNITLPDLSSLPKVKRPSLPHLRVLKSTTVDSSPTSLQLLHGTIFVGTLSSEIFTVDLKTFDVKLHITCHKHAIYDIAFPHEYSEVFATCSKDDIRIWNTESSLELLRITVPNFTCTGIQFSCDGRSIVSGWNDGEIRAFTPETGRLIYEIHNAHNKGVTAIAMTSCGRRIISGGGEGQVRVWEITPTYQKLEGVLQEHKGPVTCIRLAKTSTEAVSASSDGTCVIWDVERMTRKHSLFANTQFMGVCYHPSGVQVVTTGTDRKIGYWEVYDGSLIREIEGSSNSGLNAVDMTRDGEHILTGGKDQYIKIWNYHKGNPTHIGIGHAGVIIAVRFSPDNRHIISVSSDGGIFRWKSPYVTEPLPESKPSTKCSSRSSRSSCSEREEAWRKLEGGEEHIEQLDTSARSSRGSEGGKDKEKQRVCTCEGDESAEPKKTTPKSNGSLSKNGSTPKSTITIKNGTPPKSSSTHKSISTPPKSGGTPKHGSTPKGSETPKKGSTPKSNRSLKSNDSAPKDEGDVLLASKCNCIPKSNVSTARSGTQASKNNRKC